MLKISPTHVPPLDPGVEPSALWNRAYRALPAADAEPLAILLERPDGTISRHDAATLPHTSTNAALNLRYVERMLKFLLWSRGASRVTIAGGGPLAAELSALYSPTGARKFDHEFFSRVYSHPLTIESCAYESAPVGREVG